MKKLSYIFTLFISLSLLTACGGGEEGFGDTVIDNTPGLTAEERAVLKIANYVKYNEGKVPPLSIFKEAGLINVDDINKDSILKLISQKDFDSVNSKAELQALIDKYNTAIQKVKDYVRGNSDKIPTVKDYADIGVVEKELETKLKTLHTQLKEELSTDELDKLSLIKILAILAKI